MRTGRAEKEIRPAVVCPVLHALIQSDGITAAKHKFCDCDATLFTVMFFRFGVVKRGGCAVSGENLSFFCVDAVASSFLP